MTVGRDRWAEIDELFREILDRPPAERGGLLAEARRRDPDLAASVEELLDAATASGRFLEVSLEDLAELPWDDIFPREASAGAEPDARGVDRAGQRCGPYRIVRPLGRGGMATVYLAERADGQWQQDVAVKILRRGLDTEDVIRRFLGERQILSTLDHPNIARLLGGGSTADGLPFLAMEYVEGIPITEYCDRHRLAVPDRLRLFHDVARAVQSAHRKLVVHRDIKPSNILVDAAGRVKLLDFGIAKLLDPTDVARTRTGLRPLTPAWATPEQVTGEAITTASDAYQLGLLLCVLLSGRLPYEVRALSPARAERAVVEADPAPPSSLVTAKAAEARRTTVRALRRRLTGDLDTIVLRALRREPERRYDSAAALADDVERHLAGKAVEARPDTLAYRTAKFVGRHRVAVGAAAAAVFLLATSVAVSLAQAARATRERDRAREEAARAESVTRFVTDLFHIADPNERAGSPVTAEWLLEAGVVRADSQLVGQPQVHADVLRSIGEMYQTLGLFDRSLAVMTRAVALRRSSNHDAADLVEDLERLAEATARDDPEAGLALAEEALALAEEALPDDDPRRGSVLATASETLGRARPEEGRDRKLAWADRAVAILRNAEPSTEHRLALARALHAAGVGRRDEAGRGRLRESLELRREILGPDHAAVAATLHDLGLAMQSVDPAAADSLLEAAVDIQVRIHGPEHAHTLNMLNSLAGRFRDEGRPARAERLYREVLDRRRVAYPDDSLGQAYPMHGLGWVLADLGRGEEAEPLLLGVLRILRQAGDDEGSLRYQVARSTLGHALAAQARYAEAEPLLVESYEWMASTNPDDQAYLPVMRDRVVALYESWSRPDRAARYRRDANREGPGG